MVKKYVGVGVVVVFIVFSMVLASCSTREYPYKLGNIDLYQDLIGSHTDVTGYQLDNNEVALVVEHDKEDQIAYSVAIIDQNKEVVATYTCKADSKLDAVKTGMESTDVDKFFGGQDGFRKLTEAEAKELKEAHIPSRYGRRSSLIYCRNRLKAGDYVSPEFDEIRYFRVHITFDFLDPKTIYFSWDEGEHKYIITGYENGWW